MGSWLRYHCPRCSFDVAIGGPEEFFLVAGERRAYGHPDPVSEEAKAHGVDGFWMTLWCNRCVAAKRLVTMEFTAPCDPLDAWCGRAEPRPGFPADAEHCLDCGTELLDELPGVPPLCPGCHQSGLETGKVFD